MSRLDLSLLTQPQDRTALPAPLAPKPIDYSPLGKGLAFAAKAVLTAEEQRAAEKKQDAKLRLQMLATESKRERLNALDRIGKESELSSELIAKEFDDARRNIETKYDTLSAENPELADLINVSRAGAVLDLDLAAREFELGYREDQAKIGFAQARNTYIDNFADDRVDSARQLFTFVSQENQDVQKSIYLSPPDKFNIIQQNRNDMLRAGMASLFRQGKVDEAKLVLSAPGIDPQTSMALQRDYERGLADYEDRQRSAAIVQFGQMLDATPTGIAAANVFRNGQALFTESGYRTRAKQFFNRRSKFLGTFEDTYENGGSFADSQIDQIEAAIILGNELHELTGDSAIRDRTDRLEALYADVSERRRGATANHYPAIHQNDLLISDSFPADQVNGIIDEAIDKRDIDVYATKHLNDGRQVEPYLIEKYGEWLKSHNYEYLDPLFMGLDERGFRLFRDSFKENTLEEAHIILAEEAYLNGNQQIEDILRQPVHTANAHQALLRFSNATATDTTAADAVTAMTEDNVPEKISVSGLENLYEMRLDNSYTGTVIDENGSTVTNAPLGVALTRHDLAGVRRTIAKSVALKSSQNIPLDQAFRESKGDIQRYASDQMFVETIVVGAGVDEFAGELEDQGVFMRGRSLGTGMFMTDGVRTVVPMPNVPGLSKNSMPSFNRSIQQFMTSNPSGEMFGEAQFASIDGTAYAAVNETTTVIRNQQVRYMVPVRTSRGALTGYLEVESEADAGGTGRERFVKTNVKAMSVETFETVFQDYEFQYRSPFEAQVGVEAAQGLDPRLTWTTGDRTFSRLPPKTQADLRKIAAQNLRLQFPGATDITIQGLVPNYLGQHRWNMSGPTWLEQSLGDDFKLDPQQATGYGR